MVSFKGWCKRKPLVSFKTRVHLGDFFSCFNVYRKTRKMETPNKYSAGKIYRITSSNGFPPYIGSTVDSLPSRLRRHRRTRDCSSLLHLDEPDCDIELIEYFPCTSREALLWRERAHIEQSICCNQLIPIREQHERRMIHSLCNQATVVCGCGAHCSSRNMARHRRSHSHLRAMGSAQCVV